MMNDDDYRVVSLAAGGLYGPFRDEASARAWGDRELPGQVWNVLPITRVDSVDSHVAVLRTMPISEIVRRDAERASS